MTATSTLSVCVCIEDLDCAFCDIFINQIATGHLFGVSQPFHLVLQSSDDVYKMEDLCHEVQDCAFPMITGVSCVRTFSEQTRCPDIILVLLASRNFPYTTDKPTEEQFCRLLGLVYHTCQLSHLLARMHLTAATKVIIIGDLALTAASIMSQKLLTLTAKQLIAIDFHQETRRNPAGLAHANTGYSKITRICETLKQWWTGIKTSALTYLGIKHIRQARRTTMNQTTGYFFSRSVNLSGPMDYLTDPSTQTPPDQVAGIMATTDVALGMLHDINSRQTSDSSSSSNNLSAVCLACL